MAESPNIPRIDRLDSSEGVWSGSGIDFNFRKFGDSEAAVWEINKILSEKFDLAFGNGHRANQCIICLKGRDEPIAGFMFNIAAAVHVTLFSEASRMYRPVIEAAFEKAIKKHHGTRKQSIQR